MIEVLRRVDDDDRTEGLGNGLDALEHKVDRECGIGGERRDEPVNGVQAAVEIGVLDCEGIEFGIANVEDVGERIEKFE